MAWHIKDETKLGGWRELEIDWDKWNKENPWSWFDEIIDLICRWL